MSIVVHLLLMLLEFRFFVASQDQNVLLAILVPNNKFKCTRLPIWAGSGEVSPRSIASVLIQLQSPPISVLYWYCSVAHGHKPLLFWFGVVIQFLYCV